LSFSRDGPVPRTGSWRRSIVSAGRGVLRLLDMLFVAKSPDGTIEQLAVGNDEDFRIAPGRRSFPWRTAGPDVVHASWRPGSL